MKWGSWGRYYKNSYAGPDLSIREEVEDVVYGTSGEMGRGQLGIYRRIRRDQNGQKIHCLQCKRQGVRGASGVCDRCFGVGFLWDEEWVTYYHSAGLRTSTTQPQSRVLTAGGWVETNQAIVYLLKDVRPRLGDSLIEVRLTDEGEVVLPYIREKGWQFTALHEFRLDHGRLEYWRLTVVPESIDWIGQPLNTLIPNPGALPQK